MVSLLSLDIQTALVVEFYGVIHAIKEAQTMSFTCLWLECDFALVCVAFTFLGFFVISGTLIRSCA